MFSAAAITGVITAILATFGIHLGPAQIAGLGVVVFVIKAALIFGIFWLVANVFGKKKAVAPPLADPATLPPAAPAPTASGAASNEPTSRL